MTNSAKARLTPAFDFVIEKQCETTPSSERPGPEIANVAYSKAKRPKFEFPDERHMIPAILHLVHLAAPGGVWRPAWCPVWWR